MVFDSLLIQLSIDHYLLINFIEAKASELSLVESKMLIRAIEREQLLLRFVASKYRNPRDMWKNIWSEAVDIVLCSWSV